MPQEWGASSSEVSVDKSVEGKMQLRVSKKRPEFRRKRVLK
jgi:hypothetical protein